MVVVFMDLDVLGDADRFELRLLLWFRSDTKLTREFESREEAEDTDLVGDLALVKVVVVVITFLSGDVDLKIDLVDRGESYLGVGEYVPESGEYRYFSGIRG